MSKKSNVHPDHYKTAGRDRPDDAAAARLNRAIVAKMATRERPDRMTKGLYFERPEPEPERPATAGAKPAGAAKPSPTGAAPRRRSKAKTASPRRAATGRKSRSAPARPKAARSGPPLPAKKR